MRRNECWFDGLLCFTAGISRTNSISGFKSNFQVECFDLWPPRPQELTLASHAILALFTLHSPLTSPRVSRIRTLAAKSWQCFNYHRYLMGNKARTQLRFKFIFTKYLFVLVAFTLYQNVKVTVQIILTNYRSLPAHVQTQSNDWRMFHFLKWSFWCDRGL